MIYEFKTDIAQNIHRYNIINITIKGHFGKNMLAITRLWLYNITFKAALKYGSEVWVLNKKECRQLETAQMKFLRSLLGPTRSDHQRNTTMREKLKVGHRVNEIQSCQKNWLQHVKRLEHSRILRMALKHKTKGKRNIDRPKTIWRDQ
jgi:hypothetical protein